jgi:hypothetical protein
MSLLSLVALFGASAEPGAKRDWRWKTSTPVCSVIQDISSSGDELTISRTPGSNQTSLLIKLARAQNLKHGHYPKAALIVGPGFSGVTDVQLTGSTSRLQAIAITENEDFLRNLSNAVEIELADDDMRGSLRVPVRSARPAVVALRECEDRKMREWGIDPLAWHALKARRI